MPEPPDELQEAMAALWAKAKGPAMDACRRIADAARGEDAAEHDMARVESHKLAGMLGMYGLVEAGAAAQALDAEITGGALDDAERRPAVVQAATALIELVEGDR